MTASGMTGTLEMAHFRTFGVYGFSSGVEFLVLGAQHGWTGRSFPGLSSGLLWLGVLFWISFPSSGCAGFSRELAAEWHGSGIEGVACPRILLAVVGSLFLFPRLYVKYLHHGDCIGFWLAL